MALAAPPAAQDGGADAVGPENTNEKGGTLSNGIDHDGLRRVLEILKSATDAGKSLSTWDIDLIVDLIDLQLEGQEADQLDRIESKLDNVTVVKIEKPLRQGARLVVRAVGAQEPRGTSSGGGIDHLQIPSGKQQHFNIDGALDVDGNKGPASGLSCVSADPSIAVVTPGAVDGEFIVTDPPGAGLGTTTVTFSSMTPPLSSTETIEIIAGDAVALNVTAGAVEPRP